MAADHHDPPHLRAERQDTTLVPQQDDARLGRALGHLGVGRIVDRPGGRRDRRIHRARLDHPDQDAADHVVETRFGDPSGRDCLGQGRAEIDLAIQFLARFLIQPAVGGALGGVHRAPVGHDPAGIVPVALQHLVQQEVALAGIVAVDAVVGAHDRARPTALDGDLEGQEIAFPERRLVEAGVHDHPPGLLTVEGEMLDRRDDLVRLDAANVFARHDAGQQRILAQIFEIAPRPRVARQVHAPGQQDVEGLGPGFRADHHAAGVGDFGVEGRGGGEAGRQGGGDVAPALLDLVGHAQAGVALAQGRNAQPGHARHIAGRGNHLVQRRARRAVGHGREIPMDQLQLLLEGQLGDQGVGAGCGVSGG